jgi:hypothetical protein
VRTRGLLSLAWASTLDLFDQSTAFGRLALVHVTMMAGDTLVTISLAGSLFFSVSPTEAKAKVLGYLLLTIAPFAVVSPFLGPLIDRSMHGRRFLVATSAMARALLCLLMSHHLSSWLLFPEAFFVLVSSKLYVVTRGTLVPEMARTDQFGQHAASVDDAGWPTRGDRGVRGFAGYNAQLTFLGTLSGLITGAVGVGVLKGIGAPAVLILASVVFVLAFAVSLRLARPAESHMAPTEQMSALERDIQVLQPNGAPEVAWGLGAAAVVRFAVGFVTFLLAFGLRREHAPLSWFALALFLSAIGALVGLAIVTRSRGRWAESTMLVVSLVAIAVGAYLVSRFPSSGAQVALAAWVGLAAAVAQPSFDAITQRHVPAGAQGRVFARFAVRQQLLWVVGAVIPVAVALSFSAGDAMIAAIAVAAAVTYEVGRRVATR